MNEMLRKQLEEFKTRPETTNLIEEAVLEYTAKLHGSVISALLQLAYIALAVRLCDAFIAAQTVIWCILAAMAAEHLYATTVQQRKPSHSVRGLAAMVLVYVAPLVSDRLSTLISCWAWIQSLYVTFADHLQNDISDHDQVRVFLVGAYLSGYFSLLMRFLSECHSFRGFIAVAAGTFVAVNLPHIAFRIWEHLPHSDQYDLYYATQLLLFRLNAVIRFVAESRLGRRAPVHNPCARVRSQNAYYKYASLARNQIRVLRLLPGPPSEPIRCQLDTVSLEGDVAYQAVSYVWGSDQLSQFVIVERGNNNNNKGARLDVTASAHAVLKKLRSRWQERVLWIDGLCINQKDEDEKSSQVQMMGRVYAGAWRVVAYLGPSETAPLVQSHLARIRYLRQGRGMSIRQIRDAMLDSAPGWLALRHFFSNPWFTRVWIAQEVVLSAELHLIYGDICMDWGAISQSIEVLVHLIIRPFLLQDNDSDSSPGRSAIREGLDGACAMLELHGDFKSRPSEMTLGAVLECALCFNCGDKRDKIYGLLSLVKDPKVTPNYRTDYQEVYCSTMRQIIWADGAIKALHYAGNGSRKPVAGLPSWVSDWQYSSLSGLYNREYTAGTDRPSTVLVDPDRPLCVSVKGWRRDRVKLLSDALEMGDEASISKGSHILRAWHRAAETMAMENAICYPEGKRLEVYIRTAIADRFTSLTTAKCMEMYESLHQYLFGLGFAPELREILDLCGTSGQLWELCKPTMERCTQVAMAAVEFLGLSKHLFRNRFCVTEHGRTAIVPPRAREGDIISVLGGAGMPFLLRPQGEAFELIGCCYVYGLMERGAVDGPGEYFVIV
ncbi:hypothetical protein RB598_000306 [Gaeumannomyces tritici]